MVAPVRRMQSSNAAARGAAVKPATPAEKRAPSSSRKRTEEIGKGFVSTQVKDKAGVYYDADKEVEVLRETFEDNEHPAFVKVGAGMTINLGNFESLRIDCAVTLPCHPQNIEAAYETASNFVAEKISEEQTSWLGETTKKTKKG